MAVLNRTPKPHKPETPTKRPDAATVTEPKYQGATVDTRYDDRKSLITHIEGSSWRVSYFAQVVGQDGELTPLQLEKDAVYQQYTHIEYLELKVTSALSADQREVGKSFDVTGTAFVYPPIIPNMGDMFLADIGDGEEGVFTVTASRKMTYMKESVFEIDYRLISRSTEEYRDDLVKKTVKRVRFLKELLESGGDPLVVDEDYHQMLNAGEQERRLLGQYLASFYKKEIASLAVPDQDYLTHDPFLVKALASFLDTDEHPLVRSLKQYSVELPGFNTPRTFWDALLQLSIADLPLCHERLALVDAKCFGAIPQHEGIAFSRVEDVVYPVDQDYKDLLHKDLQPGRLDARDIRHQFRTTRLGDLSLLGKSKPDTLEPIHPVTKDDYYVFSEAFYFHDYQNQSQLETLVRRVMEGETVDTTLLSELCEATPRWGRLERFYYTPILIVLLKLVRQGF